MTDRGSGSAARRAAVAHVLVDDVVAPVLGDDAAHHLVRVLRVRDGELVTVTDGAGAWRACRLVGTALVADGDVARLERPTAVTIGVAIPKADRPEWLVQKLVELGVDRVVFLHAERSVVQWSPERAERHVAKLRRIAIEALQQSRRVWSTQIDGPVAAADYLPGAVAAEPGGRQVGSGDVAWAIGPEGGWTSAELALASARVDLSDAVLRVETAALVAAVRARALT